MQKFQLTVNNIIVNGKKIKVIAERDPAQLAGENLV